MTGEQKITPKTRKRYKSLLFDITCDKSDIKQISCDNNKIHNHKYNLDNFKIARKFNGMLKGKNIEHL